MNKLFKKIALVLAFAMVFTAMPMSVFANPNCTNHTAGSQLMPLYDPSRPYNGHAYKCDTCNNPVDSTYVAHTDTTVNAVCSDCNFRQPCTNHKAGSNFMPLYDPDRQYNGHAYKCDTCNNPVDSTYAPHTDTTSGAKCSVCGFVQQGGGMGPNNSCQNGHSYSGNYDRQMDVSKHFRICDNCHQTEATGENHKNDNGDRTCDVCGVVVNANLVHEHIFNPNVYWEVGDTDHNHRCDSCRASFGGGRHTDDGTRHCKECKVSLDSNGLHIDNCTELFTTCEWHEYRCTDPECPNSDNWGEHTPNTAGDKCSVCEIAMVNGTAHVASDELQPVPGADFHVNICSVCNEGILATKENHTPTVNDKGDTVYNYFDENYHFSLCTECDGPVESTKESHTTSDKYGPIWDNNGENTIGHALLCDVCYVPVGETKSHEAGDEWVLFDETSHMKTCGVCGAEMPSIKENHTAPNADGKCDRCGESVDANGVHNHKVINKWSVEYSQHVKRCELCGRAVEMDFHSNTNGDSKCDVCNAPVVEITEDNGYIYYAHVHQETGVWIIDGTYGHEMICSTCGEECYWEEHKDTDGNKACDVCGVVYVVEISAPSNIDYYTEAKEIDEDYVDNLSSDKKDALYKAMDEIYEVIGDNVVGVFEINCFDKITDNQVAEPGTKFKFTVTLPKGTVTVPEGQVIKWVMYRYHNGVVEKLPITDNGDGTGYFESDKFSVYVLSVEFVDIDVTHNHIWGYNTQYDAAAHWDHCHVCGAKGAFVPHSDADKDGLCICGCAMSTANRQNPATGVTAEMLG